MSDFRVIYRILRELSAAIEFDYQLNRHCAKTSTQQGGAGHKFDYQLNRHCAKTLTQIPHCKGQSS